MNPAERIISVLWVARVWLNDCAAMRGMRLSSPAVSRHTPHQQGTPTQQHDIAEGSEAIPRRLVFSTINEAENDYHNSS